MFYNDFILDRIRSERWYFSGLSVMRYLRAEDEVHYDGVNLDIFVPECWGRTVVGYLCTSHDYTLVEWWHPFRGNTLHNRPNYQRIGYRAVLANEHRRVVVTESVTGFAISSIFGQPLSSMFNFLSPDFVFIGYSNTLISRAIPSYYTTQFHRDHFKLLLPFMEEQSEIAHSFAAWDQHHECSVSLGCPSTKRTSDDRGSLFFNLKPGYILHPNFSWKIGGRGCNVVSADNMVGVSFCIEGDTISDGEEGSYSYWYPPYT
jgi:hypothetical protein